MHFAPMLSIVQFGLCAVVVYGCFCRLNATDLSVIAPLRHALALKLGAFATFGLTTLAGNTPATIVTVLVCGSVAAFVLSTMRLWPRILEALRHA